MKRVIALFMTLVIFSTPVFTLPVNAVLVNNNIQPEVVRNIVSQSVFNDLKTDQTSTLNKVELRNDTKENDLFITIIIVPFSQNEMEQIKGKSLETFLPGMRFGFLDSVIS